MRYVAKPSDQSALCEPALSSLRGWLLALLIWVREALELLPPEAQRWPMLRDVLRLTKARISHDLRESVHLLGRVLFLHAMTRMDLSRSRIMQRTIQRRATGLIPMRRVMRVLAGMNLGSLEERAERLANALDNLEPLIARMLKHLQALWRCPRAPALIATPAPTPRMARIAPLPPALADTS